METNITIKLDSKVITNPEDITNTIVGVHNMTSGLISLQDIAKRENLKRNKLKEWIEEDLKWIRYNQVTLKALLDWCPPSFSQVISYNPERDILLVCRGGSTYVNTNANRYTEFINAARDAGLTATYNEDIKSLKVKLPEHLKQEARAKGYKLKKVR